MRIKDIQRLKLPYQHKIKGLNWLLNRVTMIAENTVIHNSAINSCIHPELCSEEIIVSMTTYPKRHDKVKWTIKSLLNQTTAMSRFVIWLAEEQYPGRNIPIEMSQYLPYGVEIRFCDDLRSHKKYYYTMMESPDAVIITVDDDVIYPENTIEKLLKKHREYPQAVICNQGRWIKIQNGSFAPYSDWTVKLPDSAVMPSIHLLPVGEGGVLYPPKALDKEVFCKQMIMNSALSADDLWLKFMAMKNGVKAVVASRVQRAPSEVIVKNFDDQALSGQNVYGGANDSVIKNLSKYYPEVLGQFITRQV